MGTNARSFIAAKFNSDGVDFTPIKRDFTRLSHTMQERIELYLNYIGKEYCSCNRKKIRLDDWVDTVRFTPSEPVCEPV